MSNQAGLPTPEQFLEALRANDAEDQTQDCFICMAPGEDNVQRMDGTQGPNHVHHLPCCRQLVHSTCLATYFRGIDTPNDRCPHCRVVVCTEPPLTARQLYEQFHIGRFDRLASQDDHADYDQYMWVRMAAYDMMFAVFHSATPLAEQDCIAWIDDLIQNFRAQNFPADEHICAAHLILGDTFLEAFVGESLDDLLAIQGQGHLKNVAAFARHVRRIRRGAVRESWSYVDD